MVALSSVITTMIYFLLSYGLGTLAQKMGLTNGDEGLIMALIGFLLWYVYGYFKLVTNLQVIQNVADEKLVEEFKKYIKGEEKQ